MSEDARERSREFRVTDRRRFSSESGETGSAEATDEKIDAGPERESSTPDTIRSDYSQETASFSPVEITLSSFILGLSTQALCIWAKSLLLQIGLFLPTCLLRSK